MKAKFSRYVAGMGAAVVTVALMAMPAAAVINGTPAGTAFGNVGLVDIAGQPECSGTLFRTSPSQTESNLVMTAAHCTSGQTGQFSVTFDTNAPSGASQYFTGKAYTDPSFAFPTVKTNSLQAYNTDDVGVIVLDHDVTGVTPADLPSAGQVDTLNLKTQLLTVVGYGIDNFTNANNFTYGPRTYKVVNFVPGQRTQISDNFIKETAGVCNGDSGGPDFLKGTSTIVAVATAVQSNVCSAPAYAFRIDSNATLNFLSNPATVGVPSS